MENPSQPVEKVKYKLNLIQISVPTQLAPGEEFGAGLANIRNKKEGMAKAALKR